MGSLINKVVLIDIEILRTKKEKSGVAKRIMSALIGTEKEHLNLSAVQMLKDRYYDVDFHIFSINPEDLDYYVGSLSDVRAWENSLRRCVVLTNKQASFRNALIVDHISAALSSEIFRKTIEGMEEHDYRPEVFKSDSVRDHHKRIFRRTSIRRIQERFSDGRAKKVL